MSLRFYPDRPLPMTTVDLLSAPAGVLLPFAHIVSDVAPLHVKHLYRVPTVAQFRRQLEFLVRNCRSLQVPEIAELPNRRREDRNATSFLLSFDDGMRETYEIIAPLLRRYGVPGIFFVNSATVDNRQLMWRHKISLIIESWLHDPRRVPPQFCQGRERSFPVRLKTLRHSDEPLLDELALFYGIDFQEYLRNVRPYLTSEELSELSRNGFVIGAHSHSHPRFDDLLVEEQKNEISESVNFIRRRQIGCHCFAFPFGDSGVRRIIFDYLCQLDLRISFGTSEGRVDPVPMSFQRFRLDGPHSRLSMPTILAELSLKSLARRLSGTEILERV